MCSKENEGIAKLKEAKANAAADKAAALAKANIGDTEVWHPIRGLSYLVSPTSLFIQMIDNTIVTKARLRSKALATIGRICKRGSDDLVRFKSFQLVQLYSIFLKEPEVDSLSLDTGSGKRMRLTYSSMDNHVETACEFYNHSARTADWSAILDLSDGFNSVCIGEEDRNLVCWGSAPQSDDLSIPIHCRSLPEEEFCHIFTDVVRSLLNNDGIPKYKYPLTEDLDHSADRCMSYFFVSSF